MSVGEASARRRYSPRPYAGDSTRQRPAMRTSCSSDRPDGETILHGCAIAALLEHRDVGRRCDAFGGADRDQVLRGVALGGADEVGRALRLGLEPRAGSRARAAGTRCRDRRSFAACSRSRTAISGPGCVTRQLRPATAIASAIAASALVTAAIVERRVPSASATTCPSPHPAARYALVQSPTSTDERFHRGSVYL